MPFGSSPMASRRFPSSLRLRPASMISRTESVLINVALPRLPLPNTDTVTAMGWDYGPGSGQIRALGRLSAQDLFNAERDSGECAGRYSLAVLQDFMPRVQTV